MDDGASMPNKIKGMNTSKALNIQRNSYAVDSGAGGACLAAT